MDRTVSGALSKICEEYRCSADGTIRSSWDNMTLPWVYYKTLLSEHCFAYRKRELPDSTTDYFRAVIRVMSLASVSIFLET
jgi:hypothetical protein